jgi:hypothetical protein
MRQWSVMCSPWNGWRRWMAKPLAKLRCGNRHYLLRTGLLLHRITLRVPLRKLIICKTEEESAIRLLLLLVKYLKRQKIICRLQHSHGALRSADPIGAVIALLQQANPALRRYLSG